MFALEMHTQSLQFRHCILVPLLPSAPSILSFLIIFIPTEMIDLSLHNLPKFKQTSFPLGCNNPHTVLINPETGRLITTPPAQLTGVWKPITNNLTQVTSDISPCCVHSWMLLAADHLSLSPAQICLGRESTTTAADFQQVQNCRKA